MIRTVQINISRHCL